MNLLKSVNSWLQNQQGDEISYEAFRAMLDNSAQVSHLFHSQTNPTTKIKSFLSVLHLSFMGFRNAPSIRYCTGVTGKYMNANWAGRHLKRKEARGQEASVYQTAGRTESGWSQNATRLMWGHLSGSSLLIPLNYKVACQSGHFISSKPLQRYWSDACSFNEMSECGVSQHQCRKTYFFISICTLSLSRCQLKIYVLLSLEWSLRASSTQPHANWKSHLLTSLAFSRKINGSMNQWEGMNGLRLRGNGLCRRTHTLIHAESLLLTCE